MTEVRNQYEGTLRWVNASGSGSTWATASAPTSGLLGFVTNFTYTSAQTTEVISNRGIPSHIKQIDKQPITCSWDLLWGITGDYPVWTSGSGASVPMIHLELRSTAPEATAGIWLQIHGVVADSVTFTETNPANTQTWTCKGLAMMVTGSGYLS